MAVIFVTHDIGAAVELCDRIIVMYAGRIVEDGAVAEIIARPRHPNTRGLLNSSVDARMRGKSLATIAGSPPDFSALPGGCAFAPRCAWATAVCRDSTPPLERQGTHAVACHHSIADAIPVQFRLAE
jgi:peptide/nickel transport system ATP-binding protein